MKKENIKKLCSTILFKLFSFFPINKKKIIFISGGDSYSCNPKYLSDYMHSLNRYNIYWCFYEYTIKKVTVHENIKKVRIYSLSYYYNLSTAQYVISNHRINSIDWMKRKNQKYIQTWHSSMRLKKIEGDAKDYLSAKYIEMAKNDSENIDLIISGCDFSTKIFNNSFWYDGRVAGTGTPRIDYLLNNKKELKEKVNKLYSFDGKYILYAPTFRKEQSIDFYNVFWDEILSALEKKHCEKWKVLCKLHPSLLNESDKLSVNENVINATKYGDIQDLISASEYVISDYSSLIFDCAFIHKPCILYVPDYEEYLEKERELYFKLEELPFPIARSLEELADILLSFDRKKYNKAIDEFLEKIGSYEDGNACKRIVDLLEQL